MIRVSSDWTLFYKIFLPTVWIVFFGVATGVLLISLKPSLPFVLGGLLFYLGGVAFLYFTLIPLKRVEGSEDHLYVTNYFKTFRYPFDNILKITSTDFFIFKVVTLHFAGKTSFGQRIYFLRRRIVWDEYVHKHEHLTRVSNT